MVSPDIASPGTAEVVRNRGFIPEETVVAAGPGESSFITYYRPFWRPVLAGTFFVISVFALSWYLMLGFSVGIHNGVIALGGGVAVWLWVTACVAYYCGGMIASAMTASRAMDTPVGSGSLKGAVIWGLSIPLALVIYALIAQNGAGLIMGLDLPRAGLLENSGNLNPLATHMGFYWSAFITLALGLVFSILGGAVGCTMKKGA